MTTYSRKLIGQFSIKRLIFLVSDIVFLNLAIYIALLLRFDGVVPEQYVAVYLYSAIWISIINVILFNLFHLYSSIWIFASIEEMIQVFFGTATGMMASLIFGIATHMTFPRTVYAVAWMVALILIGLSRLSYRIIRKFKFIGMSFSKGKKRIMIVGAGQTGSMVIKELKKHKPLDSNPVLVVDDDFNKHRHRIHGIPVRGNASQIETLSNKFKIDEIIIAMPSASKTELRRIIKYCKHTKCKLKTLPALHEIINGEVDIQQIRDINIEDLLGRDPVELNANEICSYLHDDVVLITGGGGSIGSELCRQIAKFGPKKLIILDIYENNAYDLQNELKYTYGKKLDIEVLIASVRDMARMEQIFSKYHPAVVFHAAAHKHVPLMEANPAEAIKNNVFGTINVAKCADKYNTRKFVLISTDKAVNPTNIMGATKRIAEMIIQNMSTHSKTEFAAVRFGNVLGSNGSVIPLFKKQIAMGGPITVTHPDITRFFMTIPEASQLVLQAGAMANGGEIFILDMGQPVKIIDLARDLIRLSGLEPDEDIKIEVTGLRPGEKLYEELLMAEEGISATRHEKIYIGKPVFIDNKLLLKQISILEDMLMGHDPIKIFDMMETIVPTYSKVG